MLKGIDPVLTADLLSTLAAMGHGDDLALVDANHPAETIAAATTRRRPIRLSGLTMERAARAILSVLPIDDFEPAPVRRMEVVGDPAAMPAVQRAVQAEIDRAVERLGLVSEAEVRALRQQVQRLERHIADLRGDR